MRNGSGSLLPILGTKNNLELEMAYYFLPLAFAALVVMFIVRRLRKRFATGIWRSHSREGKNCLCCSLYNHFASTLGVCPICNPEARI
jgi:hypothetical protein